MCRGLLDVYPAFTDSIERTDSRAVTLHRLVTARRAQRRRNPFSYGTIPMSRSPPTSPCRSPSPSNSAHFGINPGAVIGHSAGEVAAHYLAGLLTFEQAVRVIYHRSRLQQRTSGLGRHARGRPQRRGAHADPRRDHARRPGAADIHCRGEQPDIGYRRRRRGSPRRHRPPARRPEGLQPIPHRERAVSHPLHGRGERRPLRVVGGPVVGGGDDPAVLDGDRRAVGPIRRRRRVLVAEHPRHRPFRVRDAPDAGRRVHPFRRTGPASRAGDVDRRDSRLPAGGRRGPGRPAAQRG